MMEQVPDYADVRTRAFCVHCAGPIGTRDHMPSRVFLDEPYPENLPWADACAKCNEGFSLDEEYVACAIECLACGTTDPAKPERPKIAKILSRSSALKARLDQASQSGESGPIMTLEGSRLERVLLKLGRGHARFELNETLTDKPSHLAWRPLVSLTKVERAAFDGLEERAPDIWPEVGSRSLHRYVIARDAALPSPWLEVQSRRYRYRVDWHPNVRVRIVLRDFLAAEIIWD